MIFKASHPDMTLYAPGDPPRSAQREILKEEQTREDHVVDVLPRCPRIMDLMQACIYIRVFTEDSDVRTS